MARSNQFVSTKRFRSTRKRHLTGLLASAAAVPLMGLMGQSVRAATTSFYWDPSNGSVAGTGTPTPNGTWDTTSLEWSSIAGGTSNPSIAWTNGNNNVAVFSAGTDATGSYTVNSASFINLAGITREEGTATVSFSGVLTFSGSTSGGLAINAGTASGNLVLLASFAGSPTGVITKTGTALAALNAAQPNFTGTYLDNAGSLGFFNDGGIGATPGGNVPAQFTLNGGNIRSTNNVAGGIQFSSNRGITLGTNGGGFDGANALTWAGAIIGTGPLKIAGSGNVTLTNTNNTYTGITQFSGAGANLFLTATGEMPTTTSLSFTAAGTLSLVGIDQTVQEISGSDSGALIAVGSNTLTFNPVADAYPGSFSGLGNSKIIMNGGGVQKLTGAASTAFLGEFDVNGGTVEINNNDVFGLGKLEINNDVVLDQIGGSSTRTQHNPTVDVFGNISVNDVFMASPNTIAFAGGVMNLQAANRTFFVGNTTGGLGGPVSFTIGDPIGDNGAGYGFTKTGNGTLNLTSANSYSGDTVLSAGTVTISSTNATPFGTGGTLQLAGGMLSSTGSRNTVTIDNPINLTNNSAIATASTAGTVLFEFTGPLSGSNGTLTLRNDAPTGTGNLNVRFSGSNFNFTQPIVLAAGTGTGPGTTTMVGFNGTGTAQTFSGAISGPGSLLRSVSSGPGGDTILSGANTYQGGTNLNNGGLGIGIDSVGSDATVSSGPLGTGTLTAGAAFGHIFAVGGSHTLGNTIALPNAMGVTGSNDVTLTGTITGAAGITLGLTGANLSLNNTTADSSFASVTGTGNLSQDGTNTVNVNFVRTTGLAVNGGILKTNPSASGGDTSVVSTIAAPTGKFDLNDNKLVVTGGSVGAFNASISSAYDGVSGLVANGRHGGAWDRPGIITSQSAALTTNGALTTLAVAAASDVKDFSASTTALFGGQTVHATDTLVMYTWNGDANLDGKVNADDYFQIDSHYNSTTDLSKSFHNGDFNYDGQINGDDYALIDAAFAGQGNFVFPSAPGLAGVSAVPEPASLAGIVIAAAISLKRRRRTTA